MLPRASSLRARFHIESTIALGSKFSRETSTALAWLQANDPSTRRRGKHPCADDSLCDDAVPRPALPSNATRRCSIGVSVRVGVAARDRPGGPRRGWRRPATPTWSLPTWRRLARCSEPLQPRLWADLPDAPRGTPARHARRSEPARGAIGILTDDDYPRISWSGCPSTSGQAVCCRSRARSDRRGVTRNSHVGFGLRVDCFHRSSRS